MKDTKPGIVPASMQRYIDPDKLIPTDGKIKELAIQVTGSQIRHRVQGEGCLRLSFRHHEV